MKKIVFATLFATLGLTSCIPGMLRDATKASEELQEVLDGKVFTVKTGTVTYENGTIVTFKDYGKNWASEENDVRTIVKDGKLYVVDLADKTYTEVEYGEYEYCPYVFLEKSYEFGDALGNYDNDANIKKSHETIAGKKCTVFSTSDGIKVGGWERVLFLSINEGTTDLRAKSWSGTVNESLFSLNGFSKQTYDDYEY